MYNLSKSIKRHRIIDYTLTNSDLLLIGKLEIDNRRVITSKVKRFFDIAFSLFVFVFIFSWIFPLIAILIKLSSKGSILFVQDRVGLDNVTFKCYKFRTMKCEPVKYMYTPTIKGDTRINKVGLFLRKTNLDELPQFINVFRGEMSVVGPRPHAIAFHKTYASFINYISQRQLVKPGITGLAQIMGYRGDVEDFEENKKRTIKRVEYDISYISKWNHKLDYWIIFMTIRQMLGRQTKGH